MVLAQGNQALYSCKHKPKNLALTRAAGLRIMVLCGGWSDSTVAGIGPATGLA